MGSEGETFLDLGDGRRREAADELWEHRTAAVIAGISGVGKSLQLVKPLLSSGVLDYQAQLAEILLLQHQGRWQESAELAQRSRTTFQKPYLHFPIYEAIGRIGAGAPAAGLAVLQQARIPDSQRASHKSELREGKAWLRSLAALQCGELSEASRFLGIYLGTSHPPVEADAIRTALLTEWDTRVAIPGEATPSFITPILPAAVTGFPESVRRPQYGPRVLDEQAPENGVDRREVVLAVATEWSSNHGGLSTFNRQLCAALARSGMRVFCMTPNPRLGDIKNAASLNVKLIKPTENEWYDSELEVLKEDPDGLSGDPDIIIGHGRVTGPAAKAQSDRFPRAKRLHFIHVAPEEIDWFKPDREEDGEDIAKRAEQRQRLEVDLARSAHRGFAVGERLHQRYARYVSSPGKAQLARLDPGFDADDLTPREPPPGKPVVLLFGRVEDAELKGVDLAARAIGGAAEALWESRAATEVELIVRGVPEGSSEALRKKIINWADHPSLLVTPRVYAANERRLAADLETANLVLMPSRAEGFGLVGVESIVAGTPVLVSGRSGLSDLLGELLGDEARHVVVPMHKSEADNTAEWARRIQHVLEDPETAFARAAKIRRVLAEKWTWSMAIDNLRAEL